MVLRITGVAVWTSTVHRPAAAISSSYVTYRKASTTCGRPCLETISRRLSRSRTFGFWVECGSEGHSWRLGRLVRQWMKVPQTMVRDGFVLAATAALVALTSPAVPHAQRSVVSPVSPDTTAASTDAE